MATTILDSPPGFFVSLHTHDPGEVQSLDEAT
jgi:hypothetical protein